MMAIRSFLVVLLCFLFVLWPGCGGESELAKYRAALDDYNAAADAIVGHLAQVVDESAELDALLAVDDLEGYGVKIATIGELLDKTAVVADQLGEATENIEKEHKGAAAFKPRVFFVAGAALVVAGLVGFCTKCKDLQKEASQQWKEASDTLAAVADDAATVEQYKAKKEALIETQQEFGNELGSQIIGVTLPGDPTTLGGLVVKDLVSGQVQEGSKILFATTNCATDATASTCKIGATTTDAAGKTPIFPTPCAVSISKPDTARVVVAEVAVPAGETEEIARANIPVEEATSEIVAQNDAGTYDPAQVDDATGDTAILCYTFVDVVGHYACLKYTGSDSDLQNGVYDHAQGQCLSADYRQYREYFSSDADCRSSCVGKGADYGDNVCDTP